MLKNKEKPGAPIKSFTFLFHTQDSTDHICMNKNWVEDWLK